MKKLRKKLFNMIEIALAIGILAIGIVAILSIMPIGLKEDRVSKTQNYAASASDSAFAYVSREFDKSWGGLPLPSSKPLSELEDMDGWINSEEGNIYKPAAEDGVYGIKMTSANGSISDTAGEVLMWQTPVKGSVGGGTPETLTNATGLNMEISFPVEKPYEQREKYNYYFEMYKNAAVSKAEVAYNPTTDPLIDLAPTGSTVSGSVLINPNNSKQEFDMTTPSGIITRDTLLAAGSSYTYSGEASKIKLKSHGSLKTLMVNGEILDIHVRAVTIESNDMTASVVNNHQNGAAMGQWLITINASNATITSDDTLPEMEIGEILIKNDSKLKIKVVDTQFYSGYEPVYVRVVLYSPGSDDPDGEVIKPFQAGNSGNEKEVKAEDQWETDIEAGTTYVLQGVYKGKNYGDEGGAIRSSTDAHQVLTLLDGDSPPNLPGALGAKDAAECLLDAGYIQVDGDSAVVNLEDNQVLYLFELGQTDESSSGFDRQDLIIMAEITEN